MKRLIPLLVVFVPLAAVARAADDVVIADFESTDYAGWVATGDAFGAGPARGALPGQMSVGGYVGRGLVNTYLNGDKSTGTLTSPPFDVSRDYLTFLIGGGAHAGRTCVELLVDDRTVRTAAGEDNEHLAPFTWDVREFKGKAARFRIVDQETGGWGHVNVDQVTLTDAPATPPAADVPLYQEAYRPQFHFTAARNWLNDPNGLVFYKGEYHLFFQHNPRGVNWGNMTWGHAVSGDLVHWRQRADALKPDALGTMFSGSAVVDWDNTGGFQSGDEKTLVAVYTAAGGTSEESKGKPFTQCLAYSTDAGQTWTKYAHNPVLPHVRGENRDPKIVWHAPSKRWVMALYLDKDDFAFYASPDLKKWQQLQTMTVPGCSECPDFFPMVVDGEKADDKDNMKWVWTAANGRYLVGEFDGNRFTPESRDALQVHFGNNYYAVQTYSDVPDGRRIQVGWMRGGRYPRMPFNQQMAFPQELRLQRTGGGLRLFAAPVREIELLHGKRHDWSDLTVAPGADNPLKDLRGELFDIEAEIEPGTARIVGLEIRGERVAYSTADRRLTALGSAPLEVKDGVLRLRVLVDRTSLETFAQGGRVALAGCFLPPAHDKGLRLFAEGGNAKVRSLRVTELKPALPALEAGG
jgi:sucrose-6-phosphate hydrolase SacC (GH32 family)